MDDSRGRSTFISDDKKKLKEKALKDLHEPLKNPNDRYAHICYKEKIAVTSICPRYPFDNPECELVLKYSVLTEDNEALSRHKQYVIFEDNCHQFMVRDFNYSDLKSACLLNTEEDDYNYHINQIAKFPLRAKFFLENKLNPQEAEACAFVISYYTGINSERVNRGASLSCRQANGAKVTEDTEKVLPILYFMVKALSVIPYYWGITNRCVQLTEAELEDYGVGDVVCWTQFSSSNKGDQQVSFFKNRNTLFKIYSLTGRSIQHLSNFPKQEDEVLYLPMSCFLVIDHVTQMESDGLKHIIYMRQIELGISQKTILWVDDKILEENWENKKHMEEAAAKHINSNVHFIPKTNTKSAITFLKSVFGQRLKHNLDDFRIISDMTRENESPKENAGARFFKKVRELGFEHEVLIFTSNQTVGEKYVRDVCGTKYKNLKITTSVQVTRKFISFKQ